MKKTIYILLVILSLFSLTACTSKGEVETVEDDAPPMLKKVTDEIKQVELNDEGKIVIDEKEITDKVTYFDYLYEDTHIGLFAVRNSKGKVIVVVNTCQSCGGSPYAYFVQDNEYVQCQNCGNMFLIDDLDHLEKDGCNPIEIEDLTRNKGKIIIGTEQLKELKVKFENWKGPKA